MKHWKPIIFAISLVAAVTIIIPTIMVAPFNEEGVEAEQQVLKEPKQQPENKADLQTTIQVYRHSQKRIETVALEDYVAGVVAAEMPANFELEALKAQALTARTFIVKALTAKTKKDLPEGADITDTVNDQVYLNAKELKASWGNKYQMNMKKIEEAVSATKGQLLTYNQELITPSFFSTSNGYTENSEDYWPNALPYLRSVASPWDAGSPKYLSETTIPVSEFERLLNVTIGGNEDVGKIISRTDGNRIGEIEIGGKRLTGKNVRELLGLKSSDFSWYKKGDQVIITTKGYGHGVGMSQYGANGMAEAGKSYKDIISYYYKDVKISEATAYLPTYTAKK